MSVGIKQQTKHFVRLEIKVFEAGKPVWQSVFETIYGAMFCCVHNSQESLKSPQIG